MSHELYWLTLTVLLTSVLWLPYILNRFMEVGIITAIFKSSVDPTPTAKWAERMMKAHSNAVENLVTFAPLVLIVHLTGTSNELTAIFSMVYFFARVLHAIVYVLGIPGAKTVFFIAGFVCQIGLGLTVLGIL